MRRGAVPRAWALLLCAAGSGWLAGCEPGTTSVAVRLVTAPGDDPFAGVSELTVSIEQAGETDPIESATFALEDSGGLLGPLEYGDGFSVHVEAIGSDVVLARGRSFPFDVTDDEAAVRPDVFVGTLGRFVEPLAGRAIGDEVVGVAATPQGALLATGGGEVFVYEQHGADGAATLASVHVAPERAGATWVDVGDGLLLAVGGAEAGASLFGSRGDLAATLPADSLEGQRLGAALAALPDGHAAIVIGGTDEPAGPPTDAATLVTVSGDGGAIVLAATPLARLATPRSGSLAVAVTAPVEPCPCTRVVVVGGTTTGGAPAATAVVLDPSRPSATEVSLGVDIPATGASAAAIDTGRILVAGGTTDGAPTNALTLLEVRRDIVPDESLRLGYERSGACVVPFAQGLALVAGGVGSGGAASSIVELVDVRTGGSLGDVVATGTLPWAAAAPRGVRLLDGSILVAGADGVALYIAPRGPG